MIFNPTRNYQFTTRLTLNNANVQIVKEAKLLGTYITDNLKWDVNTQVLVRKANARMQLFRKVASFSNNIDDLKLIYIIIIRSLLEQFVLSGKVRLVRKTKMYTKMCTENNFERKIH